ncbi:MAG: glycerol-3-phosphate acyltransferase, partial [Planctomycetes bacterium]|nr:glycerol-3-phosphate acyltransferase [Planctomycetota bacterium]
VLGRGWGLVVYLLDFAKGFGPVTAALHVPARAGIDAPWPWETAAIAVGAAAILGHVFPVYLRFRGGKGVATSSGVMLALAPLPTLVAGAVFLLALLVTRYVSLGSMLGAVALPAAVAALDALARRPVSAPLLFFTSLTAAAVVFLHRANVRRLLAGSEPKAFARPASGAPADPAPGGSGGAP